jgi:predicted O-methyltransferase YrrM
VQVAPAEELFQRLGSTHFPESFGESRRELGPAYLDYIFTTSSALHAVSLQLASFLLTVCRATEPSAIVDLGSGFSSHVVRRYAEEADHGIRVVSVDDSHSWLETTRGFLDRFGPSTDGLVTWEDFRLDENGGFDVVLYDLGTMETRERELSSVLAGAKPGALILVDDLHFPHYREVVQRHAAEGQFAAYDLEELTRDEFGRFAWALVR